MLVNSLSTGGKTSVTEAYLPAAQSVQDVAPSVAENLPAAQLVHVAVPVTVLYVAAKQAVHATPSGPVNPGLQTQLVKALLPAVELEFPGQAAHVEAPVAVEYVPMTQFKHREAPVPEYVPAPQSTQTLPAREYWPARHCKHRDDELAPMTEDLPAAQLMQLNGLEDTNCIEYLPSIHLTHSVPM
jgi:hypothetical protein